VVGKSGSATTVVWNPWVAKAKAMPDFGDDEWTGMLCVETANAMDGAVTLAPGLARHDGDGGGPARLRRGDPVGPGAGHLVVEGARPLRLAEVDDHEALARRTST